MKPLPDDDIDAMHCISQDRSLGYFDTTIATHLLKGNISKVGIKSLFKAGSTFDLLSLAPQSNLAGKINLLCAKDMQMNFEREFEVRCS
jgi:hypothetical protein